MTQKPSKTGCLLAWVLVSFAVMAGALLIVDRALSAVEELAGPWFYAAVIGIELVALLILCVGGAVMVVRWLAHRARMLHADDNGLYPQVRIDRERYLDTNAPGAQALAVMAHGRRLTAPVVSATINGRWELEAQLAPPAAAQPAALTVHDVVRVDPRTRPHWLLIGASGSGKTSASYAILSTLAQRYPATQFVITEPGAVNWTSQCAASTTDAIAAAIVGVYQELVRRQELLAAADVAHVLDLPQPLPYLVLVAEETETVLDDLRLYDRDTRTACILALRSIARLGRKCGVLLCAVTQSGTTDVFDNHVRKNMGTTLLFRSEHTTGETWRVSRDVKLSELPTGTAWSVAHSSAVQFPRVARPLLASKPPELPEPLMVHNWPGTARTVQDGSRGSTAVLDGSAARTALLAQNEEPSEELAETMRGWYRDGVSKSEICRRVWPAKNGVVWAYLTDALAESETAR